MRTRVRILPVLFSFLMMKKRNFFACSVRRQSEPLLSGMRVSEFLLTVMAMGRSPTVDTLYDFSPLDLFSLVSDYFPIRGKFVFLSRNVATLAGAQTSG